MAHAIIPVARSRTRPWQRVQALVDVRAVRQVRVRVRGGHLHECAAAAHARHEGQHVPRALQGCKQLSGMACAMRDVGSQPQAELM